MRKAATTSHHHKHDDPALWKMILMLTIVGALVLCVLLLFFGNAVAVVRRSLSCCSGRARMLGPQQKPPSRLSLVSWCNCLQQTAKRARKHKDVCLAITRVRLALHVHGAFGAKFFDAESGRLLVGMAGWAIIMWSPQDNCLVTR